MFFRNERKKKVTFDDYLAHARTAGFTVANVGGKTRIQRDNIAAVAESGKDSDGNEVPRFITRAGVIVGDEIGTLTDQGYQKIFLTPHGKKKPAQAEELKAIHNFQEDLREAFGLTSLYNEALGTVSNMYLYDRVVGRDFGAANKPWQMNIHVPFKD